jgi:hypothetical protein
MTHILVSNKIGLKKLSMSTTNFRKKRSPDEWSDTTISSVCVLHRAQKDSKQIMVDSYHQRHARHNEELSFLGGIRNEPNHVARKKIEEKIHDGSIETKNVTKKTDEMMVTRVLEKSKFVSFKKDDGRWKGAFATRSDGEKK